MSVENRAMLRRDLEFQGKPKLKLPKGSIVYVTEYPSGWGASFYPHPYKGTIHSFGLDPDDFSIIQSGGSKIEELVVMPPPEIPTEETEREREAALRRLRARIEVYTEEAERLERVLKAMEP